MMRSEGVKVLAEVIIAVRDVKFLNVGGTVSVPGFPDQ
jgi:hypothetical protein